MITERAIYRLPRAYDFAKHEAYGRPQDSTLNACNTGACEGANSCPQDRCPSNAYLLVKWRLSADWKSSHNYVPLRFVQSCTLSDRRGVVRVRAGVKQRPICQKPRLVTSRGLERQRRALSLLQTLRLCQPLSSEVIRKITGTRRRTAGGLNFLGAGFSRANLRGTIGDTQTLLPGGNDPRPGYQGLTA